MKDIEKLSNAACSDGNCIFKVTPEMRKGMHTNGGCRCIDEARTDYDKKSGIRELSRVAAESLAKVAEFEEQIEKLKCCGNCKHGPTPTSEHCARYCLKDLTSNVDRWEPKE